MNIIFMGTPAFAVPSLSILLNSTHNISAVVTVPDKKQGRGQKTGESEVKKFAKEKGLTILQPESLKDPDFINIVKNLEPDLIVVVAFRILPKEVYNIPRFGSINLHASLLPKYRGAAPINRAIINGEKQTGVTTFFLKDKVDTGGIIRQDSCSISEYDDAGTLHDKLMQLGAQTLFETVNLIGQSGGSPPVITQNDNEATAAPKIFKEDCRINWAQPAGIVYNFIRGLSPYPGAFTEHNNKILKIYKTLKTERQAAGPGAFMEDEGRLYVSCSDEQLEILELQPEGKKRMSASDFLRGYRDKM